MCPRGHWQHEYKFHKQRNSMVDGNPVFADSGTDGVPNLSIKYPFKIFLSVANQEQVS
jgi:hypothetical protein